MKKTLLRVHLMAQAIRGSSTGSLSTLEILNLFTKEYPPLSIINIHKITMKYDDWFINIGNRAMAIFVVSPDKHEEIDAAADEVRLQAINWKGDGSTGPQQDETVSIFVRHALQLMFFRGFNLNQATKFVKKTFGDTVHLNWALHEDKQYAFSTFTVCWSVNVWGLDHDVMEQEFEEMLLVARERKKEIQSYMRHPEDFEALLRGDLKHGLLDYSKIQLIWHVATAAAEKVPAVDQNLESPPLSVRQLVLLAFKNSNCGYLLSRDILEFVWTTFPGLKINTNRILYHLWCVKLKTVNQVNWILKEDKHAERSFLDDQTGEFITIQTEQQDNYPNPIYDSDDKEEGEWIEILEYDPHQDNHPNPILDDSTEDEIEWIEILDHVDHHQGNLTKPLSPTKEFYKDANNNKQLFDDTWTMDEEEGVYYKHEFTVEAEEDPN